MEPLPNPPRPGPLDLDHATPELFAALYEAQASAGSVDKTGRNTQRGYRYATAESVIEEARTALGKHGLSVFHTWEVTDPTPRAKAGEIGNQFVCGVVVISWVLGHASGGYISGVAELDCIASKARPHDKAVAADLTYGWGFVLRGLLNLSRGEDDDSVDRRKAPIAGPTPNPAAARFAEADKKYRDAVSAWNDAFSWTSEQWFAEGPDMLVSLGSAWKPGTTRPSANDLSRAAWLLDKERERRCAREAGEEVGNDDQG